MAEEFMKQMMLNVAGEIMPMMRQIVREEMEALAKRELKEKLLSPEEARQLFLPAISRVSLEKWSKLGYLSKYYVGKKPYYKYSEVIAAAQSLKKYKRSA